MAGNESREAAPGAGTPPVRIDTSVAHIARVQDYWLGGRDDFAADRHAGDEARVMARMAARLNQLMAEQATLRSQAEVERFFRGLRLVPPGIVRVPEWRPDSAEAAARVGTMWGGVGQK